MSRKALVAIRTDAGVTYGRVVKATEMMDIQDFAHSHVEHVVRDKLMRNATQAESAGFNYTLPGGMIVSVGEGHAIDVQGRSFDTLPAGVAAPVTISAAHVSLPRIDLIFATLIADQDEEPSALPFRRLLSTSELDSGADPYPITDENVNTRRDNVAVIGVRQGVPNASPPAPALGANEIPRYQVRVDAGATAIAANKVTDVRRQMKSLADALVRLDTLETSPAIANLSETIDDRFAALFGVTPNTGLAGTYNDAANSYALAGVAATAGAMGMMPAADKAKLDAATDQPTVNTLVKRDANGDVQHRRIVSTIATGTSPLQVASQTEVANLNANMVQGQNLANLDSRFINASGDTMTGNLYLNEGGTDAFAAINAALRVVSATNQQGVSSAAISAYQQTGLFDSDVAYGIAAYANANRALNKANTTSFGIYAETGGGASGTRWAGYFNGNVNVVGSFTASSKNYIIDHPLDPNGKTLLHGVVEMNGHGLLYPIQVTLADGAASVSLDEAIGATRGTLKRSAQRLMVMAVYSEGAARVTALIETPLPPAGEEPETILSLSSDDGADASVVNVLIIGHRADDYIKASPYVDGDGILIVEWDKPALTAEDEALLEPITEEVPLIGQTLPMTLPSLIGKLGFPYHPEVIVAGVLPTRDVTFVASGS